MGGRRLDNSVTLLVFAASVIAARSSILLQATGASRMRGQSHTRHLDPSITPGA